MASIVVYMDARDGVVTGPARFALGEARRVADELGATVYALVALPPTSGDQLDSLAAQIGAGGADRILCCADQALAGPPLDATHGALLAGVADRLRPNLFLFPPGGSAAQLAPSLAVRSGAAFLPCASIEVRAHRAESSARLILRCWRAAHDGQRTIDVCDLERPVVATLSSGIIRGSRGEPAAEMEMLVCAPADARLPRILSAEPDPAAEVAVARSLVVIGKAIDSSTLARLQAALPAQALALAEGDARLAGLDTACPERLLVLAAGADWRCPRIAPGTTVALIADKGQETAPARLVARPEKDELGGLVAALESAALHGETP